MVEVRGAGRGNSAARRLYVRTGFRDEGGAEPLRPGSIEQAQPMILEVPGKEE